MSPLLAYLISGMVAMGLSVAPPPPLAPSLRTGILNFSRLTGRDG
jgi:hypothetical protein